MRWLGFTGSALAMLALLLVCLPRVFRFSWGQWAEEVGHTLDGWFESRREKREVVEDQRIGEKAARHWKTVHRAVVSALDGATWRRIEMAVDVRDPGAKRWAAHLGFSFEGVARKWTTDGRDVEQWARVT